MPTYNPNLTPPPNKWGIGPDGRPQLQLPPQILEMLANRQAGQAAPSFARPGHGGANAQPGMPVPFNPAISNPVVPGAEMPPTRYGVSGNPTGAGGMQFGGAITDAEAAALQQRLQGAGGGMPPTGQLNVMPDKRQLRGLMDYLSR